MKEVTNNSIMNIVGSFSPVNTQKQKNNDTPFIIDKTENQDKPKVAKRDTEPLKPSVHKPKLKSIETTTIEKKDNNEDEASCGFDNPSTQGDFISVVLQQLHHAMNNENSNTDASYNSQILHELFNGLSSGALNWPEEKIIGILEGFEKVQNKESVANVLLNLDVPMDSLAAAAEMGTDGQSTAQNAKINGEQGDVMAWMPRYLQKPTVNEPIQINENISATPYSLENTNDTGKKSDPTITRTTTFEMLSDEGFLSENSLKITESAVGTLHMHKEEQQRSNMSDNGNFAQWIYANSAASPKNIENTTMALPTQSQLNNVSNTVINQIVDSVITNLDGGRLEFSIQMKPDFLGNLAIKLTMQKDGSLIAKLQTSDLTARGLLSGQIDELQLSLKDRGINIVDMDIVYQEFTSDPNSGNAQNKQYEGHKAVNAIAATFDPEESLPDITSDILNIEVAPAVTQSMVDYSA